MAILVSPPFNRPQVGQRMNYQFFEQKMLVRLQQGIGRIIRGPLDWGVALLLDDRFLQYVRRKSFSQRLGKRVEVLKSNQVTSRVNDLFSEWNKS